MVYFVKFYLKLLYTMLIVRHLFVVQGYLSIFD